jgi:hypothetical protein
VEPGRANFLTEIREGTMLGVALVCISQGVAAALLAAGEARQEQLFQSWKKAQADTRSLAVEFIAEKDDPTWPKKERWQGTVKLLRTPKGEWLASYAEADPDKPGAAAAPRVVGLLNRGNLYLLHPEEKRAGRFVPTHGDVRLLLERYFNPLALLLDEKHARSKYRLAVTRQDEWYTYLEVEPRKARRWERTFPGDFDKESQSAGAVTYILGSGWLFLDSFDKGRAVFMNKGTPGVPKDMPRQLWYRDMAGRAFTIDIRRWKANAADGPTPEEFTRPEDRPGWEVNGRHGK